MSLFSKVKICISSGIVSIDCIFLVHGPSYFLLSCIFFGLKCGHFKELKCSNSGHQILAPPSNLGFLRLFVVVAVCLFHGLPDQILESLYSLFCAATEVSVQLA